MRKLGLIAAIVALAFPLAASAGLYKWVDENGKTQYSDKPPLPQNAKSQPAELNKRGMVVKDPAALEAESAARAKQKDEEQRLLEQRRRDNALIKTFTKPEEVDLLRDRALEGIEAEIKTHQLRRQAIERHLGDYQKRIAILERNKKPVPDDLAADIKREQDELKRIDDMLKNKDQEKAAVRQKADDDKKRLLELRSGQK